MHRLYSRGLSINGANINLVGDHYFSGELCDSAIASDNCGIWPLTGSSVSFGDNSSQLSTPNILSFTGNTSAVIGVGVDHQFKLGTFSFTNGSFFNTPNLLPDLYYTITTHSDDIAYDKHQFSGLLSFADHLNDVGQPFDSARYITFYDSHNNLIIQLKSVGVYTYGTCPNGDPTYPACNTGTVDLIGHIGSLDLDKFTNPTGGAFIGSPVSAVPLPSAFWFFGTGLIAAARYRKSR